MGTATDPQEAFAAHPQLTETVLQLHVETHEKAAEDMTEEEAPSEDVRLR